MASKSGSAGGAVVTWASMGAASASVPETDWPSRSSSASMRAAVSMVRPVTPLWSTSSVSVTSQVVWASGSAHSSTAWVTAAGVPVMVTVRGRRCPPSRADRYRQPRTKKPPEDCSARAASTAAAASAWTVGSSPWTVYVFPSQRNWALLPESRPGRASSRAAEAASRPMPPTSTPAMLVLGSRVPPPAAAHSPVYPAPRARTTTNRTIRASFFPLRFCLGGRSATRRPACFSISISSNCVRSL